MQKINQEETKTIPDRFLDVTTQLIFYKPVVADDGNTYEEQPLLKWANSHNYESPLRTNVKGRLVLNRSLKTEIEEFLSTNPQFRSEQYSPENPEQYLQQKSFIGPLEEKKPEEHDESVKSKQLSARQVTLPYQAMVINDTTPLIERNRARSNATAGSLAGCLSCVCVVAGTIVVLAFILRTKNPDLTMPLENIYYEFKAPYAGGGTVIIHNENNFEIEVSDIQFFINGIIATDKQGTIYGDLAPWGEAKIINTGQIASWYGYKIIEPGDKIVAISAHSQKNFTYVFSKTTDVLNVVSLPKNISMTTTDNDSVQLSLYGRCTGLQCEDPSPHRIIGGYYTNWDMYGRAFNVRDIPIHNINEINYAFINFDQFGNLISSDFNSDNIQLPMLMQLAQQHPYLKVVLSLGGAGKGSENFSTLAANSTAVQNFANNLVALLHQFNFSGIDIDWEYPSQKDAPNFVTMLRTIRETLDMTGRNFTLSIAAPAGKKNIDDVGYLWRDIIRYVTLNVMGYDYSSGAWSVLSDYQSPYTLPPNDPNGIFNSLNVTLELYYKYGVLPDDIVLGIPAYFRGVVVNNSRNFGLWQPVVGVPPGQFDASGIFSNACVFKGDCRQGISFPSDAVYLNMTQAPYANFSRTPFFFQPKNLTFFTGDCYESAYFKSHYAKQQNLRGVFFWTFADDVRNDAKTSLISAAYEVFNANESSAAFQNVHEVNDMYWDDFRVKFEQTIIAVMPIVGGFGLTFLFYYLNKITDQTFTLFVNTSSHKHNQELLLTFKMVVYFVTFYSLGLPLLPSAAGIAVGCMCKKFLRASHSDAHMAAAITSFVLQLTSDEAPTLSAALVNYGLAFAGSRAATSLLVPETPSILEEGRAFYQRVKNWGARTSSYLTHGFFAGMQWGRKSDDTTTVQMHNSESRLG